MTKTRQKACLVLHEDSRARPDVAAAVDHVRASGVDLDLATPESREALHDRVQQAIREGTCRIVAGGGDGTLNAVVTAMMACEERAEASLGILALGTANDFARGIGINSADVIDALELACIGTATPIDVGQMNDRYFINAASAGFGAEVTAHTPQDMKRVLGGVAYSIMGFVKAFQFQPYDAKLSLPDGTKAEGPMLVMNVSNSRFAGGGYDVAPRASLRDGLLDVTLVSELTSDNFGRLVDELGDPHPYAVVRINQQYVTRPNFEHTSVPDDAEVYLIPMVAGG